MTPSTRSFKSVQPDASPTSRSWFRDVQERIRRNVQALRHQQVALETDFLLTLLSNVVINAKSDSQLMQRFLEMNPSPLYGDFCSCWDSISCWLEKRKIRGFYWDGGSSRRSFDMFFWFTRIIVRTLGSRRGSRPTGESRADLMLDVWIG
jgi:hypothetical protein